MSTISPNNNLSPLAFYPSLEAREQWWGYGKTPHICVPKNTYPSFQIRRPHTTLSYLDPAGVAEWSREEGNYIDGDGNLVSTEEDCVTLYATAITGLTSPFSIIIDDDVLSDMEEILEIEGPVTILRVDWEDEGEERVTLWKSDDDLTNITLPENITEINLFYSFDGQKATPWFIIQSSISPISKFNVRDINNNVVLSNVPATLKIVNIGAYDYIFLNSIQSATPLGENTYYLEIGDGTNTWYSDSFTMRDDDYLKLEWWNESNLEISDGTVVVAKDTTSPTVYYTPTLYLRSDIGMPDYEFEDEVEERGGYQFPLQQISYKKFKFVFLAPEVVCDAMRTIRLSDHIRITKGEKVYTANTFLMTPAWQDQGFLASVECEFTTDTIIKKSGSII